jgi:hypothetical protein
MTQASVTVQQGILVSGGHAYFGDWDTGTQPQLPSKDNAAGFSRAPKQLWYDSVCVTEVHPVSVALVPASEALNAMRCWTCRCQLLRTPEAPLHQPQANHWNHTYQASGLYFILTQPGETPYPFGEAPGCEGGCQACTHQNKQQ